MPSFAPSALLVLLLAACAGDPPPPPGGPAARDPLPEAAPVGPPTASHPGQPELDRIPADNPVWSWDAGGFVPSFAWYGEASWDDVRMRVAGHLAAVGRDRARARAAAGDLAGAAAQYRTLEQALAGLGLDPGSEHATRTVALLRTAAQRDAALCAALAAGSAPPVPAEPGLAALRARFLGLALTPAGPERAAALRQLQRDLEPFLTPRDDLDLEAFADFQARHGLRVRLLEAALDSLDPLALDQRWGFWDRGEIQRQALALGLSAATLGADDWSTRAAGWIAGPPPAAAVSPIALPSAWAATLRAVDQQPRFTVEGLGRLPTGDSLVDVAGWPGPAPIGQLARLGLDDPSHRAWLEALAAALNEALATDPAAVPPLVERAAAELDALGHGSRYYNIKQLRNEAVRQLARGGHAAEATAVLEANWPLHHQDWACPDREGILLAIAGRLELLGGQPGASLDRAWERGLAFLAMVDEAEAAGLGAGPPPGPAPGPPGAP